MSTVGIIVEYNPFHNGHLYHLQESKRVSGAENVIAVMSGHFLQRGEPALVHKWARAEMALYMGVDLVIELPLVYAAQNAETFAHGAVSLLDELGVVDFLCFGSESGELSWMQELARLLAEEPPSFTEHLHRFLNEGLPYPKAYGRASALLMKEQGYENLPVDQPNNILGLNYLLSLVRRKSKIQPLTITRQKAGYHQEEITDHQIASATAIRKLLIQKNSLMEIKPYVPSTTYDVLRREMESRRCPMTWDNYYSYLLHQLIQYTPRDLQRIHEMNEGLEHRLKSCVVRSRNFEELMQQVKTKRYTWNRLQRLALYTLLNLTAEQYQLSRSDEGPQYIRVLGFTKKGQNLLKQIKQRSRLPIITNLTRERQLMLELDIRAGAIYALGYPDPLKNQELLREFEQPPVQV